LARAVSHGCGECLVAQGGRAAAGNLDATETTAPADARKASVQYTCY
jgi:hypothetical protein